LSIAVVLVLILKLFPPLSPDGFSLDTNEALCNG